MLSQAVRGIASLVKTTNVFVLGIVLAIAGGVIGEIVEMVIQPGIAVAIVRFAK